MRRGHGLGADDDVADPGVQIRLDGVFIPDPATELHRDLGDGLANLADHPAVDGSPGASAIEIDQMQPARPGLGPVAGHGHRVL